MIYEVRVEDSTFEIEITSDLVRINGESVLVDLATLEKTNDYSLILDGVSSLSTRSNGVGGRGTSYATNAGSM